MVPPSSPLTPLHVMLDSLLMTNDLQGLVRRTWTIYNTTAVLAYHSLVTEPAPFITQPLCYHSLVRRTCTIYNTTAVLAYHSLVREPAPFITHPPCYHSLFRRTSTIYKITAVLPQSVQENLNHLYHNRRATTVCSGEP